MAELIVLGLLLGGVYVAVGLGFSLVWGILNIVNLAYGALVMIAGYITWILSVRYGLDPFLSIPVNLVVMFAIGYAVQYVAINRIVRAPFLYTFLITFGLDFIVINAVPTVFYAHFLPNDPAASAEAFRYSLV